MVHQAVTAQPDNVDYLNTLALALHRNQQDAEAIAILKSNTSKPASLGLYDWIVLAMCEPLPGSASSSTRRVRRKRFDCARAHWNSAIGT